MKKALIAFLLCSILGMEASAQKFGWGFTGGLSLSTVTGTYPYGDKITNAELIPGFLLGAFFKFRPRRFISLSTGVNYISKGANIGGQKGSGFNVTSGMLRTLYFEVPILIQFNFSPYTSNRPNLFIGPSLSWAVSVKDNFTIDYYGPPPPPMMEVGKYYTTFDPGIIIGGGIDIDVSDWKIFSAGVRYTHGFTNTTNSEWGESGEIYVDERFELKNINLSIFASLTFVVPTYTMNGGGKKKRDNKYKSQKPKNSFP